MKYTKFKYPDLPEEFLNREEVLCKVVLLLELASELLDSESIEHEIIDKEVDKFCCMN